MIVIHFLISAFIFLTISLPAIIVSPFVVAPLLLTRWSGRTTIFGNRKWGRATNHYLYPTKNKFWREFIWLVVRNPVNNLGDKFLAVTMRDYDITGNENIGDKIRPGFYAIEMGWFWEYYLIRNYYVFGQWRCLRVRIGWKISGNGGETAMFCFVVNPVMKYSGF